MTALALRAVPGGTAGEAGRRAVAVLGGLVLAVAVRVGLNGPGSAPAFVAGAVFAVLLGGLAVAAGFRPARPSGRALALGCAGGLVLVALPALARPGPGLAPLAHPDPLVLWVLVTAAVVIAEEAVLRGVLFDDLRRASGVGVALVATSVAFALLHVPLYGWHVVPLDIAVGLWLGGLRLLGGGIAAPAVAHLLADLASAVP